MLFVIGPFVIRPASFVVDPVKWLTFGADATNAVGVPGGSSHVPFRILRRR
jgi:hypothetical protein